MSTRRTRRTAAAAAEVTEEVVTIETRSTKRTRGGQRKAAATKVTSTKAQRESTPHSTTPSARDNTNTNNTTRAEAVASTPAPATASKRRLRSTQPETASPLRALDEQPAKKQRTTSKKTPARAKPEPVQEESNDDTGIFFSKSEPQLSYPSHKSTLIDDFPYKGFESIALQLRASQLEARNTELEEKCKSQSTEISHLHACVVELEEEIQSLRNQLNSHQPSQQTEQVNANAPPSEFDSFNVDQSVSPETEKATFITGDESAMALLRHVQEASKVPKSTTPPHEDDSDAENDVNMTQPTSPQPATQATGERPSTPTKSIFSSFTSPFTAFRNLFGQSTTTPPPSSPTPIRGPAPDTLTEVLSMAPTPVGERAKRPSKKAKKPNRLVKALLQGVEQEDIDKATAWAKQVAADLRHDSTAGDKRKRLEVPVLFRDLKHFPASKPWQSGFSLPEDVLDLEDDDVVPAWAVYTSMLEEERQPKKTKTVHTATIGEDMPASINEVFGINDVTASKDDFQPRRSIDPSPMFETPLKHQEGGNVFNELRGHDAVVSDRKNLKRALQAESIQRQNTAEKSRPSVTANTVNTPDTTNVINATKSINTVGNEQNLARAHDPSHGSFSVPDSDSEEEEEEEVCAQPVWTQAPPPAPTPSHAPLPTATHNEEVERQRQKLMKHTPHKPSRLQQVSYPSPSLLSDAGNESMLAASPIKFSELFGQIPEPELITFGDPDLDAAVAAIATSDRLQQKLASMNWSQPIIEYESDEEELSPV
jgi:uncharacterized coiled-coil protein SlyX